MSVYLGVDGGGTKTAFCVINSEGRIVGHYRSASVYPSVVLGNTDDVGAILIKGVARACAQAKVRPAEIAFAFLGLPGYGEFARMLSTLDGLPKLALGHDRYLCDNDMVCGWAGAFAGADGINLVSGTGSIAYGRHQGRNIRAGGWGQVFGDEGSAYWIGVEGLRMTSQILDGRKPRGLLVDRMTARLEIRRPFDLIELVESSWKGDRARIADLAPTVTEAAADGDPCALDIVHRAALALVQLVDTVARRLNLAHGATVKLCRSGGVFDAPIAASTFEAALATTPVSYSLQPPLLSPAIGAAVYAAQLAGKQLGPAQTQTLVGEWKSN